MFGGRGFASTAAPGGLNDLWYYNVSSSEWNWMGGSDSVGATGNYGTRGVGSVDNIPGARDAATTWIDSNDNLWLFGGLNFAASNRFNDLWKYTPSTREWTWVSGTNMLNALGNYGVQNVSSPTNSPGARFGPISWTDSKGNLWLFGGYGLATTSTNGYLNDLWKFVPSTNEWTWMGGSKVIGQLGSYG
jgi:N-acetylneuraminic acid mutarotase